VVVVEDVDRAVRETYTLMTGALLDIDAGQVSLASPIGQALLGVDAGAVVTVQAPQRRRTLRVLSVCTLRDRLEQEAAALTV
jgi:transcription elongation factor GreA